MKSRMRRVWVLGLSLLVLPLAGGCLPQASSSAETAVAVVEPQKSTEPAVQAAIEEPAQIPPADGETSSDISDAPATPVSDDITVPANLRPTPAVSEVIKMANSGVGESVMLTVVTNSTSTFNLRPEEIIYLTDIGVPATVVTAMLQHDHLLQAREPYVSDLSLIPPAAPIAISQGVVPNQYAPEPALGMPPEQAPPAEAGNAGPQYAPVSYPLPEAVAAPAQSESAPDFYDSLAPYGTWVDVAGYGRCWQPTAVVVDPGWQPYCERGHWVYSGCGWYWMSDYSWGWAPFHYGRWFEHQRLGWCWVPDNVWGPSWVCWRYSQNYCGWAALPPAAGFTPGVGMTFHGQKVNSNSSFGLAAHQFHFVSTDRFTDRHVNRHVVSREQATKIFGNTVASTTTTMRNDTVVISGIPKDRIAAVSHTPVPQMPLHANPSTVPLPNGQLFNDKVPRNPVNGSQAQDFASASRNPALPQKPLAAASFSAGTMAVPHQDGARPASDVTTVVSQPQAGKPGPLIIRGPNHPAPVPRPAKEPGNSTLVVIGSRHPAPATGFTHNTPQPVHLPSAQQNQPLAMASDKSGNSIEPDSSSRFHQAMAAPNPEVNGTASGPQQSVPWWVSRPSPATANRSEVNQSPVQPSAPAYVSHPAAAESHHSPTASQASAPAASPSPPHSAPSAPASHSQSSGGKGSR